MGCELWDYEAVGCVAVGCRFVGCGRWYVGL